MITNGSVTITKYTGADTYVVIPDTIDGLPVTALGDLAFDDSMNLTKVSIPASVTSIGLEPVRLLPKPCDDRGGGVKPCIL